MSPWASFTQVGRPWLHWPERGVTSISRRRAFISATESTRPARTEPWNQTIARLQTAEGLLVGLCYTPWLHGTEK